MELIYSIDNGFLNITNGDIVNNYQFKEKNITSVNFCLSIIAILESSFHGNQIQELNLPSNLAVIGSFSFSFNQISRVLIPDSVEKIGTNAFDNNVTIIYHGREYKPSFWNRYGSENIIKISKMQDLLPNIEEQQFENIFDVNIVRVIPLNNDALKSFITYKKLFNSTLSKMINDQSIVRNNNYAIMYKLFYTLGFFNVTEQVRNKIIELIYAIFDTYGLEEINKMFKNVELKDYYPQFAETVLNGYKDKRITQIISKYYNQFKTIALSITTIKKERMRKINQQIIRSNDADILSLKEKQNKIKSELKTFSIDDIFEYLSEHVFKIREGNESLKDVANFLSGYMTQEMFDIVQDIYEKSKNSKSPFKPLSGSYGNLSYEWLESDNPNNLILGYICDCCAKLFGYGEDIMIQSMLNPNIKNLIIYDLSKRILAKATAYYNFNGNYMLINSIAISESFMLKSKEEDKEKLLDIILKGLQSQIDSMRNDNVPVNEIRIRMLKNSLEKTIQKRHFPVEKNNLLLNYAFHNYDGNASDSSYGQAIIKM